MFRVGKMIIGEELLNVYELESQKTYRLDITADKIIFNKGLDGVKFSLYKDKKEIYTYGDEKYFKKFKELKDFILESPAKTDTVSYFEGVNFIQESVKKEDDENYCKQTKTNNNITSIDIVMGDSAIRMKTKSEGDLAFKPVSLGAYIQASLKEVSAPTYNTIEQIATFLDIKHLYEEPTEVVHTLGRFKEVIKEIDITKDAGFDTETTGLEVYRGGKDLIVGCSLYTEGQTSYYFMFRHNNYENLPIECLGEIVEVFNRCKTRYGYNCKFDRQVVMKEGHQIFFDIDGLMLSKFVDPEMYNVHALKKRAYSFFGKRYLELDDFGKNVQFQDLDIESVRLYACYDAINHVTVSKKLWEQLDENQYKLASIECELANYIADQEFYGIRFDPEVIRAGYEEDVKIYKQIEDVILKMIGYRISLSSDAQVSDIFYNKFKFPVFVRTKEGNPSVGTEARSKLISIKRDSQEEVFNAGILDSKGKEVVKKKDLNATKYPIVLLYDRWVYYNKLMTAFYARMFNQGINNRYYFWMTQIGPGTGRQSSPVHQLPKSIKKAIISDSSKHNMAVADYSQVELRLVFEMAGEERMIAEAKKKGNDLHRAVTQYILKIPPDMISSEMRSAFKAVNFGVVYQMSKYGLAAKAEGAAPSKAAIKKADKEINAFFNTFPRVYNLLEGFKKKGIENKYISTAFFRKRKFYALEDENLPQAMIGSFKRKAANTPVQGTAADIMKIGLVYLNRYIKKKGWDKEIETEEGLLPRVRVSLSVHDEAQIHYDKTIPPEEIMIMVRDCLEFEYGEHKTPLFTGLSFVNNWLQGKEDKYEMPTELRDHFIKEYIEKGTSVCKGDDHCTELCALIDKDREAGLKDYMDQLISENDGDVEKIVANLNHPSLTHDLIARYFDKSTLDQMERKRFAVESYLKGLEAQPAPIIEEDDLEEFISVDEIINEDALIELEEEYEDIYDVEELYKDEDDKAERISIPIYLWRIYNTVYFDTKDLSVEEVQKLSDYILTNYSTEYSYYNYYIIMGKDTFDTGAKVDSFDMLEVNKELNDLLEELRKESVAI